MLLNGLASHLPEECAWVCPGGGFFVWLRLPPGVDSGTFLPIAESVGVSYMPGGHFYAGGGGGQHCRLAFTLVSPEDGGGELNEGARRLGAALRDYQGRGRM